jgi:ribosomal protein S18 acetylase RimI-like enzyme
MTAGDWDAVTALWRASPGIELNESDTRDAIAAFLERNPELSAVALASAEVVGAVLAGHDGRRGYLHHLAVTPSHRSRGIARALLDRALDRLAALGIVKCNVFILEDNVDGASFWRHAGFGPRDFRVFQRTLLHT